MNSWSREQIWQVAMEQSARDCGCTVEQLLGEQNTVLSAKELSGAKKYYQGRHFCQMISYGHGTVAVVNPAIERFVRQYLQDYAYREAPYVFYRNGLYYFMWSVFNNTVSRSVVQC